MVHKRPICLKQNNFKLSDLNEVFRDLCSQRVELLSTVSTLAQKDTCHILWNSAGYLFTILELLSKTVNSSRLPGVALASDWL